MVDGLGDDLAVALDLEGVVLVLLVGLAVGLDGDGEVLEVVGAVVGDAVGGAGKLAVEVEGDVLARHDLIALDGDGDLGEGLAGKLAVLEVLEGDDADDHLEGVGGAGLGDVLGGYGVAVLILERDLDLIAGEGGLVLGDRDLGGVELLALGQVDLDAVGGVLAVVGHLVPGVDLLVEDVEGDSAGALDEVL